MIAGAPVSHTVWIVHGVDVPVAVTCTALLCLQEVNRH